MSNKNKLKGCLICGAVGDAVGGPFEGSYANAEPDIDFDFDWKVSDDTQLTLATCEAIIGSKSVNPEAMASRFLDWFNANRLTGLGSSTVIALKNLQKGVKWQEAANQGEMAAGNGAAMRIAPLAFAKNIDQSLIKEIVYITHHNEEAFAGALAIYLAVKLASEESWNGISSLIEMVERKMPPTKLRNRLSELKNHSNKTISDIGAMYKPTGYVVDSVPVSIFAAQQINTLSLDEIFTELIKIGGDTDTTCSMAGQIVGALRGTTIIPENFMNKYNTLDVKNLIEGIVDKW